MVRGEVAGGPDGSVLHVADEDLAVARQAVDEAADLPKLLAEARAQAVVDQDGDLDVAGASGVERV